MTQFSRGFGEKCWEW